MKQKAREYEDIAGEPWYPSNKMTPQVQIRDSPFDPRQCSPAAVEFERTNAGVVWYRVYLYLAGPELSSVRQVQYLFPPGMSPPIVWVTPSAKNPQAVASLSTPKTAFSVWATIWMSNNIAHRLAHTMRYDKDFNEDTDFIQSSALAR